jgi:branched-chain amino acid transport system substrate-binding protein
MPLSIPVHIHSVPVIPKSAFRAMAVAVAAAALCAGCASANSSNSASSSATGPLTIGVILPLSGSQAALGLDSKLGVQAAANELNAHGGILGRHVNLLMLDDANEPTNAASDAREAIQDKVAAVFGDIQTANVAAEASLLSGAQIPVFTSAAGTNLWTGTYPYLFGSGDKSSYMTTTDTNYVVKQLGISDVGILYQNDAFGLPSEQANLASLKSLGITPKAVESFDPTATDVTAQLNSLKSAGVKAVFAWTYGPGLVAVARGMQAIGWHPPTITDTGLSQAAVVTGAGAANLANFYGGPIVKNFMSATPNGAAASATAQFVSYFRTVFGSGEFDGQQIAASEAYDAIMILAEAMKLAHSSAGPAVKTALESGHTFTGARTTYVFSPTDHVGENVDDLSLFKGGLPCNVTCLVAPGVTLSSS